MWMPVLYRNLSFYQYDREERLISKAQSVSTTIQPANQSQPPFHQADPIFSLNDTLSLLGPLKRRGMRTRGRVEWLEGAQAEREKQEINK